MHGQGKQRGFLQVHEEPQFAATMADDGMRIVDEEKLSAAHLLGCPYQPQLNQSYPNSAWLAHPGIGVVRSQSSQGRTGLMS